MLEIKGYLPTSLLEWRGKISAVVFLPHCNFRCPFCYNKDLVLKPEKIPNIPLDFVLGDLEEKRGWLDGVVITGGEPTLNRGLGELIERIKMKDLLVMIETNGSNPEMVAELSRERLVDFWAMDIKAPFEGERYERVVGVKCTPSLIEEIRRSVELIKKTDDYEFRTTVVPGLLSGEEVIEIAKFLGPVKNFYLQQFQPKNCLDSQFEKKKPYSWRQLVAILGEVKKYTPSAKIRGEDEKI